MADSWRQLPDPAHPSNNRTVQQHARTRRLLLRASTGALPASADAVPRRLLPSCCRRPLAPRGGQLALLLGWADGMRQMHQVAFEQGNLLIKR